MIKRNESSFIDDQGKESVNFQITIFLAGILVTVIGFATCCFGFVLAIPLFIFHIVYTVIGAVQASHGEYYRYPYTIRFIS